MIEKKNITDGIIFEENESSPNKIVFNFRSWVNIIIGLVIKYTDKSKQEAEDLVFQSPIICGALNNYRSVALRSHETEYHWAMTIVYGERYWDKNISVEEPQDYFEWESEYRLKNNLAKESFEFFDGFE
ncbi:hypothetical protein EHJ14_21090 [Cronobacter sakazakii]|nr:hypothetical protein [Cronobacter sakazakii]EKK3982532.1 hypothetical protein [Cronobacter sakazakii]EKK4002442.1 hypothetical protein [Cronobacter sakazakii]ELY4533478.1 hypothetical protein [Cronobacter sakazakii]ELY6005211.1 hypothetical protein [Cronobacter sakazakii]ELY6218480.1 hypothetical protein [Cronobacter sakazakii]